ncbi:TPA: terminase small subunit [Mannheimia haemolytica]|uniref:terminase small subunit n=1 Tax=Mannheimia haemolytica TaxID=75985 RepID=UPI002EC56BC9|nr:terminase small subunit [Mannheimia haemolytica]
MPRIRTETLTEKQEAFCIAYLKCGNILKAYQAVNTGTMKPHSMRARASEMMNDYRVFNRLKQLAKARKARGERLPTFRKGSLMAEWLGSHNLKRIVDKT